MTEPSVRDLQRCPYYRGRECMILGISGTKRAVRNSEVAVRRGYTVLHYCLVEIGMNRRSKLEIFTETGGLQSA